MATEAQETETAQDAVTMDKIVALCKRRGFVFQSSDIYGGLASTYNYGHYGVLLKSNVKNEWWRAMIQERDDIVALDAAILMHPRVWEASGHLEGFTDPLVQCLGKCKRRWREDHLREAQPEGELHCPECGGELTEPRQFNLMFKTHMGPVEDESAVVYLPPAEAQKWHEHWLEERMRWYTDLGLRPDHLRLRAHGEDELSHYSSGTSDIEYHFPIGWSELEGIAN